MDDILERTSDRTLERANVDAGVTHVILSPQLKLSAVAHRVAWYSVLSGTLCCRCFARNRLLWHYRNVNTLDGDWKGSDARQRSGIELERASSSASGNCTDIITAVHCITLLYG